MPPIPEDGADPGRTEETMTQRGAKRAADGEDSSIDGRSPKERKKEKETSKPIDWSSPPLELRDRGEDRDVAAAADFVTHFIRYILGLWHRKLDEGAVNAESAAANYVTDLVLHSFSKLTTVRETEEMLEPLVKQVEHREVDEHILRRLDEICSSSAQREYIEANKAYIEVTLRRKNWHNAYFRGEAVQKYVQAIRRIIMFSQWMRPNDDPSKHI
eukprot:gnl/TRDRNA2_/TRDRNA2_42657_c0_seq1.p1 gnl/TRDRNA2_/TRDRNA2_42657_c0~~gnl/TRDRNA2_/TRDRNA2_42657_c0_seq1.p1  ORF type:complete len:215 (-),score=49.32 gnl/TRDRNA2_/TRDRNA2_42657_c0_seq1:49-693(-)